MCKVFIAPHANIGNEHTVLSINTRLWKSDSIIIITFLWVTVLVRIATRHEISNWLFFFSWSNCFFDTLIPQDENILLAQNRSPSSRFSMQCVQSSAHAVCVCNSTVSFSEMSVMYSKPIKTGQEIICIIHDNSYTFQNPQELFRKNAVLSASKCFTNNEAHIQVIMDCQISIWQII